MLRDTHGALIPAEPRPPFADALGFWGTLALSQARQVLLDWHPLAFSVASASTLSTA